MGGARQIDDIETVCYLAWRELAVGVLDLQECGVGCDKASGVNDSSIAHCDCIPRQECLEGFRCRIGFEHHHDASALPRVTQYDGFFCCIHVVSRAGEDDNSWHVIRVASAEQLS